MPRSKRPRKQYKPKPIASLKPKRMSVEQQIKQVYGKKTPYCGVCKTECVLARQEDVDAYKKYDTSYPFDFIYVPACDCWETNEDWMEL